MEHRSLVLLGLLMAQSQHGYQINEFIENNLCMITNMKKPTAYATLEKLSKNEYIDVKMEQEGNRPPRKVYTINQSGRDYFFKLLRKNLSSAETVNYEGDLGLMFMDYLPAEEAEEALQKRLESSEHLLSAIKQTPSHGTRTTVDLAVKHKIKMLEAEIDFLRTTLIELSQQ